LGSVGVLCVETRDVRDGAPRGRARY
jgi:hypothetical protein